MAVFQSKALLKRRMAAMSSLALKPSSMPQPKLATQTGNLIIEGLYAA